MLFCCLQLFGALAANAAVDPGKHSLAEVQATIRESERLDAEGNFGQAAVLRERACSGFSHVRGERSEDYADCINQLGGLYLKQGDYERALPLIERAIDVFEERADAGFRLADALCNMSTLHQAQGLYGKAELESQRALELLEGSDSELLVVALHGLAGSYQARGAYADAANLFDRALAALDNREPKDWASIAVVNNDLALLERDRGAFLKSGSLYQQTLRIYEEKLGVEHPFYAVTLANYALLQRDRGMYEESEISSERALLSLRESFGDEHPYVASVLNNLALSCAAQGKYEKAEALYRESLAVREEKLGPHHPDVAISLSNLASLYRDYGALEEAEDLLERALDIQVAAFGWHHAGVAATLGNMGLMYRMAGELEKAEEFYRRALTVDEEIFGTENVHVGMDYNNLGVLYKLQGKYDEAELNLLRAREIDKVVLGSKNAGSVLSWVNLANLYQETEEYDKAEEIYVHSLAVLEEALGPEHNSVGVVLANFAELHYAQGRYGRAVALHERSLEIEEQGLSRTMILADEARRLDYMSTLAGSLDHAVSLHLRVVPEMDSVARIALTTLLRRKNRVQGLVGQANAALREVLPEDGRRLLDELSDLDSRIAAFSNRHFDIPASGGGLDDVRLLQEQRRRLWRRLGAYRGVVEAVGPVVTIEDVQRALAEDEVLVDFVLYTPQYSRAGKRVKEMEVSPEPHYAAYLTFFDRFDWVELGPAAAIDGEIESFRAALQTRRDIPDDLQWSILEPIIDRIPPGVRLIISPAGSLNLVPFGAIYDGERFLVETRRLRYVDSGRDLLRQEVSSNVASGVVVVSNPTGAALGDAEVEGALLQEYFADARILHGDLATETNVRKIERPTILHLATHGFSEKSRGGMRNPMFRSGVLLADIEQVQVDEKQDDGRLTAYEVSGMDFRGTELVVLSACRTGLGEVDENEGVFGLRRAFAVAGARTTVVSLWDVSGVAARRLMKAYYGKLEQGLGRAEAMQAVQLEMLRGREHAHPKDWAAFIVSGDDEPMSFAGEEEAGFSSLPSEGGPPPFRGRYGCAISGSSFGSPLFGFRNPLILVLLFQLCRRRS